MRPKNNQPDTFYGTAILLIANISINILYLRPLQDDEKDAPYAVESPFLNIPDLETVDFHFWNNRLYWKNV